MKDKFYNFDPGRFYIGGDVTYIDEWSQEVAAAIAEAEPERGRRHWRETFEEALADFKFLPAGRIIAGAGPGAR